MSEQGAIERRALRISIVGYFLLGALAVVFALISQSEAIMLDGFFNIVSLLMSFVTLYVARLLLQPVGPRHQYGYSLFEPFVNTVKGLLLFGVCALALVSAVDALIDGGRPLSAGPALIYSLIATVSCVVVFLILGRVTRGTDSPLLALDLQSWRISGVISAAVALGFGGAFALGHTQYAHLVPYVDPLLVVILVLMMIKVPLVTIKDSVSDLLLGAPPEQRQADLRRLIEPLLGEMKHDRISIRSARVGRNIFVTVSVLLDPTSTATTGEFDRIREEIDLAVADLRPRTTVDVMFTGNQKWVI